MWMDRYTKYMHSEQQGLSLQYLTACMHGLLSRPCELQDIFKKTIYSNEIQENYTTQNHKRLCKSYYQFQICNIAVWSNPTLYD